MESDTCSASGIPEESFHQDAQSAVIFLDVERKDIVLYQALFESYEGVGTVRTVDKAQGILSIITTSSMLSTVLEVLHSISPEIRWRFATHLHPEEKSRYVEML